MEGIEQTGKVAEGQGEDLSEIFAEDPVLQVIEDVLNIYVPLFLSLCGIVCNLLNMIIFCMLGLKDSMSINVFALSFSDFLMTFLYAVVCLCYLTDKLYPTSNIDAFALGYVPFGWMMNATYLTSCWITAVITIERFVCVVLPFKVKQIFTTSRSTIVIVAIYTVFIGLHVPLYVIHKMDWVERPSSLKQGINLTETRVLVFTTFFVKEVARIEMIFDVTVSLALSDLSFIILIVCTVLMIRELKSSSKIRRTVSIKGTDSQNSQLSTKERKLVKVALALAITLSACSLPRVLTVITSNSIPDANTGSIQSYVIILWAVSSICITIGCSNTIFVYLALNSNYRTMFYKLLERCQ